MLKQNCRFVFVIEVDSVNKMACLSKFTIAQCLIMCFDSERFARTSIFTKHVWHHLILSPLSHHIACFNEIC